MKKKCKRALLIMIVALLAVAWVWRYYTLNDYYSSRSSRHQEFFSSGDMVPFGTDYIAQSVYAEGYTLRVDDFEIVDFDEYITNLGLDIERDTFDPEKLALVYITLRNENSEAQGVMLTELELHGLDSTVGMNWSLLLSVNPVLDGNYGISLRQGSEYSLILPYNLQEEYFGYDTWRQIHEYSFWLQITGYPTQKEILVQ